MSARAHVETASAEASNPREAAVAYHHHPTALDVIEKGRSVLVVTQEIKLFFQYSTTLISPPLFNARNIVDQPEPRGEKAAVLSPTRLVVYELITPFAREGFPASCHRTFERNI
jgi:hypothetical protein